MKSTKKFFGMLFPVLGMFLTCCSGNDPISPSTSTEIAPILGEHNYYENPIHPIVDGDKKNTYIADPYVVRDGDNFYLYSTQTDVYTVTRTKSQFVRGPIWHSTDMVNWVYKGNVFQDYNPTWGTSGAGVWAPTVIKLGDKWNYYYAFSVGSDPNPGIGVATSSTPYGPWEHKGKLFNSNEIGVTNSIDAHVFVDNDKVYMVFGSFGGLITLIELTSDGLALQGGVEYQKEHKIALGGYEVFNLDNYEASFILKRDGYYYLFLSTGSCCSGAKSSYHVVVARSEKLEGPYLDSEGRDIFHPKRGDTVIAPTMSSAMGVGHCCVLQDDKENYWMYYHGYNVGSTYEDQRVLYMDLLVWDKETNMPKVNGTCLASHGEPVPGPYLNSIEANYE